MYGIISVISFYQVRSDQLTLTNKTYHKRGVTGFRYIPSHDRKMKYGSKHAKGTTFNNRKLFRPLMGPDSSRPICSGTGYHRIDAEMKRNRLRHLISYHVSHTV